MWEAGFDTDRERRSDGVTVRRAARGQAQPRVQLLPPPPVAMGGVNCWVRGVFVLFWCFVFLASWVGLFRVYFLVWGAVL